MERILSKFRAIWRSMARANVKNFSTGRTFGLAWPACALAGLLCALDVLFVALAGAKMRL